MYFKKLLKKLCIFNIVTLMSCNLVPSQTIADPINVPVSGDATTTFPLDSSNLGPISVVPAVFTGQNVTLNIPINKIEVDPTIKKFKTAADFFVEAANLAQTASTAPTTANWVALANKFKEAAFHTAEAVFTNKDKSSTVYIKFIEAYTAANTGDVGAAAEAAYAATNAVADYADTNAANAADSAATAAAYAAKTAAYEDADDAAFAAKTAAKAAAFAAAYAAAVYEDADKAYDAANAADSAGYYAREAVNKAVNKVSGFDYKKAITSAQNAADSIITYDFVDVIYGDSATHDLWVRLTAKTEDDDGKPIDPTPPNASESTEWVQITNANITESRTDNGNLTSITVSADMGKALMPGNYNVYVILTARETT